MDRGSIFGFMKKIRSIFASYLWEGVSYGVTVFLFIGGAVMYRLALHRCVLFPPVCQGLVMPVV